MSTLEKLFMHAFDRKQWIGVQLRQQVHSYEESLACNLAAKGHEIPPWLFDEAPEPGFYAPMPHNSNQTELNRKQIITDLLFPSSRVTTPANHSTHFPTPSYNATQSFQDSPSTGACFFDNHIRNLQTDEEIPSTSLEKCNEDQNQTQHDMTNIGAFSTIQRSRSRQKDIEKRSSVKKAPGDTATSFRQTDGTKAKIIDTEQIDTSYECRMGESNGKNQGEKEISTCHLMNPDLTETLSRVEDSVVGSKGIGFDVALTVSRDNLDFVTEKHIETMKQRSHFNLEKDISSLVGESCGMGDGEKRKEADLLKNSTSHLINPVSAEAMDSVESSAFEPKRLAFSLALATFGNNLDSVAENQDESRDGSLGSVLESKPWYPNGKFSEMRDGEENIESVRKLAPIPSPHITAQEPTCTPNNMLNDAVELKIPTFDEPGDRPGTIAAKSLPSPKRLGLSGSREAEIAIYGHNSLSSDGVRGDEERHVETAGRVNCSAPYTVNTELNESSHCIDNDDAQNRCSPPIKGLQQVIKSSLSEGSDMRMVDETIYARDSYSPICDVTGFENEATEVNGPAFIPKSGTELDQSVRIRKMELENLILPRPMEVVGDEVLDLSDKQKHSVTSRFHGTSGETSLSGACFDSCRSHQTTLNIVTPEFAGTNLKTFSINPKSQGEGSLLKNGEGIKHLSSSGRYFLRSSAIQENSNTSALREGTVVIGGLKSPGKVHFNVDAKSWPKRRKMEVFSNFSVATSPRPRKRPVHTKTSYFPMEENESETSVLVLEEYHRIPSMSSSSADNRKETVSPNELNIDSPIFNANHFSISPREGDVANTFKYVPEIDALNLQKDDLANSAKYTHDLNVGTSLKCDVGSFIDQEDSSPELEGFTIGVSSDSEGETRIMPKTIPLQMERASLAVQLSPSMCNTPGSSFLTQYDTISNVYKSLPSGHFDFLKVSEASSVPPNDTKQLSASVSSILYQSGPFGYPGFEADTSASGKPGRGRPPLTTPVENFGYKRGIPPLTPPAQTFSYRKLSETSETGNLSGKGSGGIRSSTKTPLYPDLTCFRIDEDAAEDDVPNENDPFDPQDLPEESAFPSVNDSQNLQDDDGPNYQNTLQDITDVLENTKTDVTIHENILEGGDFTGKKPKQSAASLSKRELCRKASGSMRSGLATADAFQKGKDKSFGTVSSKPSNIVSDVTSFVPLVKQKQQPVAKKRDVRIPALEAAEANKRLQEKKMNERELQRAAMKAEREKLNQEKVLKKKQEEGQKKEAGMAAKKRQREEREKKDKEKDREKKRKCTDMDHPVQREEPNKKEPQKRTRVAREEKDLQHNVIDEKEQSKRDKCGKEDAFIRSRGTGSSIIIIDDEVEVAELPRVVAKSYEMSPYKDSDAEGDDDRDEAEEDRIRRKKFIPSWARKEYLEDYLQSKKYLNPELIFSCKCSFDMTKVLKPHNQKGNL